MTITSSFQRSAMAGCSIPSDSSPDAQESPGMASQATRLSVERIVAELRAGRPVRVTNGVEARVVFSVEMLIDRANIFADATEQAVARLVLPKERLAHLGVTLASAGAIRVIASDHDLVSNLTVAPAVDDVPAFQKADVIESAAIDALKFAQLLPAVLVVKPEDADAYGWTLSVTVSALQSYHHEVARGLEIVSRAPVPLERAENTEFVIFRGSDGFKDQVAIVVGAPDPSQPVPIRLHSACLTGDLFGSLKCDCGEQLRRAISTFAEDGGGVLLYLDQEGRGIGLANKMRAYKLQHHGLDTLDADRQLGYGEDGRRYEIAAQMVAMLGYDKVSILTNNPRKIAALKAHGIEVADRIALVGTPNPHNARYLKTKVERSGHLAE
ncbi:MAG: GTP cyclohydrolase II RibA [Pseudomonadota bacterium]